MPPVSSPFPHTQPVELSKCYRLLNHGPTVLVSAAHGERRNVMAAAWSMPLDFAPPKVAVVIDKNTLTRSLVEASGGFALHVPCKAQADIVLAVGSATGREVDKFERLGLRSTDGRRVDAPLIEGCVGWMECRLVPEPHVQQAYDLFIAEVVAAWADERAFGQGRWHEELPDALRTLHYVAGGRFFAIGEGLDARSAL
ncbi:MAG TPA: flavin reductase family protein [Burkholderiaceae bacterium]|nr:flavin reductase family protein [Burkholderiaceae bacterium]